MDPGFSFERRLRRDLDEAGVLRAGDRVVVAVSGGPDSMALLTALCALGVRHGRPLDLRVAHVNHGLRGAESERDASFVEARALSLGLPFHRADVRLEPSAPNLEARARAERHAFLSAVARENEARHVALGHTLDDQAETVLLRLARGAGPRGLAAMELCRADGVVRPLLRRRRAECVRYLDELGVPFVHDASNSDLRFERNRVRHEVLPLLAERLGVDVAVRLAALADDLRVEADLADDRVARLLGDASPEELPVAVVRDAGAAASRIVHAWLARSGLRPSRAQAEALVRLARGGRPSGRVDLGGIRIERRYAVLARAPAEPERPRGSPRRWRAPGSVDLGSGVRLSAEIGVPQGPRAGAAGATWVDADRIEGPLAVRGARAGDRIRLRAGHRKLSDVFIDARVPKEERWRLAVVTRGADIVWVPGVVVASSVAPHRCTNRFMRLGAERADCRSAGTVVKMQDFRVEFG